MQCHKNPEQINLLLNELKHPEVDIFVHIDSKCANIRNAIKREEGIFILPENDCVNVKWAQFSQVQATLNLLNASISNGGYFFGLGNIQWKYILSITCCYA